MDGVALRVCRGRCAPHHVARPELRVRGVEIKVPHTRGRAVGVRLKERHCLRESRG